MQILVILAFAATLTVAQFSPWQDDPRLLGVGLAGYILVALILARLWAMAEIALLDCDDMLPLRLNRRRRLFMLCTQFWLVGGSTMLMYLGFDAWSDRLLQVHALPMTGRLLDLLPFIVGLMLVWAVLYPAHSASRRRALARWSKAGLAPVAWTRGQYIAYNLRHQLLFVLAPATIIFVVGDMLAHCLGPLLGDSDAAQLAQQGITLACSAGVVLLSPAIIVRIWKTHPMPAGELRSDLEALGRRMGIRYRDIRIWQTGGMTTNAAVIGLITPVRYVLITDALLTHLEPYHVQAVFAHEAGHARSHHLLYLAVFAGASIALAMAAREAACQMANLSAEAGQVLVLVLLIIVWTLSLGWISRRFERQSDVIAAWAMGQFPPVWAVAAVPSPEDREAAANSGRITQEGAALFAGALERVAQLNGSSYRQHNWMHGSIARRVEYILWLGASGGTRRDIDLVVRRIKIALWIALLIGVAATTCVYAFAPQGTT